jgi:hypothetical protein
VSLSGLLLTLGEDADAEWSSIRCDPLGPVRTAPWALAAVSADLVEAVLNRWAIVPPVA